MSKAKTIEVKGSKIAVIKKGKRDFISLTDMVKNFEDGLVLIEKWLRNKNTIEFIGIWEQLNNPGFNSPEFEGIKNEAGLNRFTLSITAFTPMPSRHTSFLRSFRRNKPNGYMRARRIC